MTHYPGGGIDSKNVKHTRNPKTEPNAQAADVASVSQVGQAVGFEADPLFSGPGYNPPPRETPWSVGPGVGRRVMPPGSQGHYGPSAQGEPDRAPDVPATRPGRDILRDYGPESK